MQYRLSFIAGSILALASACGSDTASGPDGGDEPLDASGPADAGESADAAAGEDAASSADAAIACTDDSDCGDHAVCEGEGTSSECVCVPAYADDGDGCAFAGAPEDPGFEDAAAWSVTGDAVVNPEAAGDIDPGVASFNASAVCSLDSVFQVFEMPAFEDAEPFVVDVRYRGGDFSTPLGAALAVAGGWTFFPSSVFFADGTACLGEGGYGGDVEFRVAPDRPGFCDRGASVDRLSVSPAEPGQCPLVGEVLNGDFEAEGGWEFETSGDGEAAIAAGAGAGGTAGLQLTKETRCSSATARGTISVPLPETVPNPALSYFRRGSEGDALEVELGGFPLARLAGTGDAELDTLCLPTWSRGLAPELTFSLPNVGGTCADPDVRFAELDNVEIIDAPGCEVGPLTEPGFESVASSLRSGWKLEAAGSSQANLLDNTSAARTGSGALELVVSSRCESAIATTSLVVPAPEGGEGPALTLFHTEGHDEPEVNVTVGNASLRLPKEAIGYDPATLCLPPELAGRPATLRVAMRATGTCADTFPARVVLIDDLEVTTDPSCPTE